MAHLGYFRTEFVERRRWLDDRSYSDLVALCLCGPAHAGASGWLLELGPQPAFPHHPYRVSKRTGLAALAFFGALLVGLPLWAAGTGSGLLSLLDGFYRAGALVFGGGHVVLPLLQSTVVPQAR